MRRFNREAGMSIRQKRVGAGRPRCLTTEYSVLGRGPVAMIHHHNRPGILLRRQLHPIWRSMASNTVSPEGGSVSVSPAPSVFGFSAIRLIRANGMKLISKS